MTISAQIIADSVSPEGHRLTTFQLRYPRFIHAELMTHRVFSRNASSSRAIPIQRLIEDVMRDPAYPISWGRNQKGMQAKEDVSPEEAKAALELWLEGRNRAVDTVFGMLELGIHKQIANRLMEPWSHINVVLTGTSFANFYALRDHEDAQPEIQALAGAMKQAQVESTPVMLIPGEWHLPYIRELDVNDAYQDYGWEDGPAPLEVLKKVSVARCGRVSYLTHDGRETTIQEDLELYGRLVERHPIHASPAEHQATPDEYQAKDDYWFHQEQWGNLTGWRQLRKLLPGEYVADEQQVLPVHQRKSALT